MITTPSGTIISHRWSPDLGGSWLRVRTELWSAGSSFARGGGEPDD
jgi:hypothetical protein